MSKRIVTPSRDTAIFLTDFADALQALSDTADHISPPNEPLSGIWATDWTEPFTSIDDLEPFILWLRTKAEQAGFGS